MSKTNTEHIEALIEARDYLGEAIESLESMDAHPPQPVVMVDKVARFRENPIVRHLLDTHPTEDMNTLARRFHEHRADQWQFAQLIGYSVSGGGGLPYANESTVSAADKAVDSLVRAEKAETRAAELESDNDALRSIIGKCYRPVGREGLNTLDEVPDAVEDRVAELEAELQRERRCHEAADEERQHHLTCVEELENLVGWAQHHVDRSAPACNEFLDRAFRVLGRERALNYRSDQMVPEHRGEGES